ncbi:MAG: hypothetical protein CTY32_02260 [Methylotenera sp.]|nr:MAG: hypothetical protein CTY32_02260 [Methylotenera sp.]
MRLMIHFYPYFKLLSLCLMASVCFFANLNSYAETNAKPTIKIFVTVDWEGWSLDEENIEVMQAFRKQYPHIPMMQLLNPVYLLRPSADTKVEAEKIRSTFLPSDSMGLHVHGWKSLLDACEVPFQNAPSFTAQTDVCEAGDCGYAVSLEYAYSAQDLTKLIACSANLLVAQGFARPRYFRAGGWQLGPKLASALEANQFVFDSSRTDANLLTTKWAESSGLVQMVKALHPEASVLDQPYQLTASVMEYPNNGSLADYTDTQQLLTIFKTLISHDKRVLVLGFHQETAFSYLKHLQDAIPLYEEIAREQGITIDWVSH